MRELLKYFLLLLLLILIALPRFNWRPLPEPFNSFVGGKPFDVEQYEKYVEFFRGDYSLKDELEAPFSYRPFVPFLASLLPFDALSSINIVNLLLLLFGIIYLIKTLKYLMFAERVVTISVLIFVVSFPVFYYTTSGYIDASLIGIILILNYYLIKRNSYLVVITFLLAILVKETILVTMPAILVFIFIDENKKNKFFKILSIIVLYFITESIVRYFAPSKTFYLWKPSFEIIEYNLVRVKTYLSFILTFGISGVFSFLYLFKKQKQSISKQMLSFLYVGLFSGILLWIYSFFTAHADGRHIWITYPYSVLLSSFYLQEFFDREKAKNY